jgi:hypothetical protein
MTLYPSVRRRRNTTLAGDLAVLLLIVLFAWLGLRVHDAVAGLASLGRGLQDAGAAVGTTARDAAGAVRDGFGAAAGAAGAAPVIGGSLEGALRQAGASAAQPLQREGEAQARRLVAAGKEGEARALRTAKILGWLTFLGPTLLVLTRWGPPRVRQVRTLTAAPRAGRHRARPGARGGARAPRRLLTVLRHAAPPHPRPDRRPAGRAPRGVARGAA